MMQPKFDDVIEYVKAGENDPDMKKTLSLTPDGQELLKQARFICKVLQHQAESTDDAKSFADMPLMANSRMMESMEEPSVSYQQSRRVSRSMEPELRSFLVGGVGGDSEDLGTLELTDKGDTVAVSYVASGSVKMRSGKPFAKKLLVQADIQGIEIRGRGITMSLPDVLPTSGAMAVRVTAGVRQMPAQGLPVILMPDSGPFVRLRVDGDGNLELAVPDQAGTLRVETDPPQLLRIKLKK